MNAIGYLWSDSFRGDRINEVLEASTKFSMEESQLLQTDNFSGPAREWVPYLKQVELSGELDRYKNELLQWDFELEKQSTEAAIYVAWEKELMNSIRTSFIPKKSLEYFSYVSMTKSLEVFRALSNDDQSAILRASFTEAISKLKGLYGEDLSSVVYGSSDYKHISLQHPLSPLLTKEEREQFDAPSIPRGGNSYALNNTSGNNKQTHGASFRIIVDTGDFNKSVGANSPGQSGDPRSPHYKDLYESWANDSFFPVHYRRDSVMKYKDIIIRLESE